MARLFVVNNGQLYTLSMDDQVPIAARIWAVASGRVIDEITGQPPSGSIKITTTQPGLMPRVGPGGMVGFVGVPLNCFPNLALHDYAFDVTIEAEGYIAQQSHVTIPAIQGFPDAFLPGGIGDPATDGESLLFLHREPVVISGRTVLSRENTVVPLSDVTVSITTIWRTFPPAHIEDDTLIDPNYLVSLLPPVYASRDRTTAQLRHREVVLVVGEDKHLLQSAAGNTNLLSVSNRVNIAAGELLMIDADNPDLVEYIIIDTITGASSADQPARISLIHPLAFAHRNNAVLRKVTLQAPGDVNDFGYNAISGDTSIFLISINDLSEAQAQIVEIAGGAAITGSSPATEYHNLRLFSVKSDIDGYFRFPPLSRVAQIEIQAELAGLSPSAIKTKFSPNYFSWENRIDFVFKAQ